MATLTIDNKYLDALRSFGNLEDVVQQAVQEYAVTMIKQKIDTYQQAVNRFKAEYGMPYAQFYERILHDEVFEQQLWHQNPAWRTDLIEWEYYDEGLTLWHGRLQRILNG